MLTDSPATPPVASVDSIVSFLASLESSADVTRTAAEARPPVAMALRTILFAVPAENVTPSPLGLTTTASSMIRPALPSEMIPAADPLICASTRCWIFEAAPPLPVNASEPLTPKLGVPASVTLAANVALPYVPDATLKTSPFAAAAAALDRSPQTRSAGAPQVPSAGTPETV